VGKAKWILAIVCFCVLAGCASTATGSSRSALLMAGPVPATEPVALPGAGTLVVVRYPAVLEPEARIAEEPVRSSTFFWILFFSALATRSTRWRLG